MIICGPFIPTVCGHGAANGSGVAAWRRSDPTRAGTTDRKALVASFALRYGWSAGAAIAPFLLCRLVPNVSLENISIKFAGQHHLFERVALHRAEGIILANTGSQKLSNLCRASSLRQLRQSLRHTLIQQATPIVEALHHWSRFSTKAI
jgi:hypothetical protein